MVTVGCQGDGIGDAIADAIFEFSRRVCSNTPSPKEKPQGSISYILM